MTIYPSNHGRQQLLRQQGTRLAYSFSLMLWCCLLGIADSLGVVGKNDNYAERGSTSICSNRHGGRHICLLDDYDTVRGPYFSALFDQLMGETQHPTKNLAYFTSQADLSLRDATDLGSRNDRNTFLEELRASLALDDANLFLLDEWNPLTLESELSTSNPTIVWVQGKNAFRTRHLLRTSGLDRWLEARCAPLQEDAEISSTKEESGCHGAILYVGEDAGALCAGSDMAVARARGDDPKMAPEPQFVGLNLLGDDDDDRRVSFGVERELLEGHPRTCHYCVAGNIQVCRNDHVFVWSQSPTKETATTFLMTPSRRGTIEHYTTPDPWLDRHNRSRPGQSDGGVACFGEPAIEPSRSVQRVGDSEWMDDFS
jgi:hypothetical protein